MPEEHGEYCNCSGYAKPRDLMEQTRQELSNLAFDISHGWFSADDFVDVAARNIEWILQCADPDLVERLRKALQCERE